MISYWRSKKLPLIMIIFTPHLITKVKLYYSRDINIVVLGMEIVLDDSFVKFFERHTSNKGIPASGDIIIVISEQGVVLIQLEE